METMTLKTLYKQNKIFFLGYFLLAAIAIFLLIFLSKADAFVFMNPLHTDFFNWLFITFSLIGDGIFSVALAIIFFVYKEKFLSLMIFTSFAISGIATQILKNIVSEARPALFLEKANYPYFIDGITLHNLNSFPSGHSTSIFALAAILTFALKDKRYSVLFLIVAALVGYSRIYLGQHFIDDVLAGSLVGILTSIICWISFEKYFKRVLKIPAS